MTRRRRIGIAALVVMAGGGVLAWRAGAPLPEAPAHALVAPPPAPSAEVEICWLEYGRSSTQASHSRAGWSSRPSWEITVAGLLIRHPKGHLVVDVGNSTRFLEEIAPLPFWPRLLLKEGPGSVARVAQAADALRAASEDPDTIQIVISHLHPDHAGAIRDLPLAPVWLPEEEIDFARREAPALGADVVPATAEALGVRARPIPFQPVAYSIFDRRWDVHGDGAVVVVPLFGHTPGSVGVFVTLPSGKRLFHVGDAVSTTEAIDARVGKGLVMAWTDYDGAAADRMVSRLAQLHTLDPDLVILPAHDRVAWQSVFGEPSRCVRR